MVAVSRKNYLKLSVNCYTRRWSFLVTYINTTMNGTERLGLRTKKVTLSDTFLIATWKTWKGPVNIEQSVKSVYGTDFQCRVSRYGNWCALLRVGVGNWNRLGSIPNLLEENVAGTGVGYNYHLSATTTTTSSTTNTNTTNFFRCEPKVIYWQL